MNDGLMEISMQILAQNLCMHKDTIYQRYHNSTVAYQKVQSMFLQGINLPFPLNEWFIREIYVIKIA